MGLGIAMTTTYVDLGDVVEQNGDNVEIKVIQNQHTDTIYKGSVMKNIEWSNLFVGDNECTDRLNNYLNLDISPNDIKPHIMDDGSVLIDHLPEDLLMMVYDEIVKPVTKARELTEPHQKHTETPRWNYYNLEQKVPIEIPVSVVEDAKRLEENSLLTFKQSLTVLLSERGYRRNLIARRLDISENTVDDRLAGGRKKLDKAKSTTEMVNEMDLEVL